MELSRYIDQSQVIPDMVSQSGISHKQMISATKIIDAPLTTKPILLIYFFQFITDIINASSPYLN